MLKKIFFLVLLLVTVGFSFESGSFGLNVNSDDVEFEGRASVSFLTGMPIYSSFFVCGNYLKADEEDLYSVGISVENSPINYTNLVFDIGIRGLFSQHGNQNFTALPITFGAKAQMFLGDLPPTYFGVKLKYAPEALSFEDAYEYKEYRVQVDSNVIPNINLYAGYRNINTDYKTNSYKINDSFYAGFKFTLDPR